MGRVFSWSPLHSVGLEKGLQLPILHMALVLHPAIGVLDRRIYGFGVYIQSTDKTLKLWLERCTDKFLLILSLEYLANSRVI